MLDYRKVILEKFLDNKELVENMMNCDHAEPGEHNPYHLEGDVWTHTMMVYSHADNYNSLIMALCHDIGKVLTRNVNNGKVTFYGHADASIQPTIDFLTYLLKTEILTKEMCEHFVWTCLNPMANHMLYYQNLNKLKYFADNSYLTELYFTNMASMDSKGSISKSESVKGSNKDLVILPFEKRPFNPDFKTVYIYTGLPGSGKDYLASLTDTKIVSFDDIRVDHYKEMVNKSEWFLLGQDEIYNRAFIYCNEKKVDLNKILKKRVIKHTDNGNNVSICNTSLTRKARRTLINTLGPNKFNYVIKQVFTPTDVILKRNNSRDKFIPTNVIYDMMKKMTVATHFEDHINSIEYILNL